MSTVWPVDHREDHRSSVYTLFSLVQTFLQHCTLTNKAMGTIRHGLSKLPQRRQGPDPSLLWFLVKALSSIGPGLTFRWARTQPIPVNVSIYFYIAHILFLSPKMCFFNYLSTLHGNISSVLLKLVRTPLHVLLRGHFLKYLSLLSLYAPITSDECHTWFHLNAARPAERNTEQVNNTKHLIPCRIRTPNTVWPPGYKSTVFTTRPILKRYEWRN